MKNKIYNEILEHFETNDSVLEIEQSYDLSIEGAFDELDMDNAQAWRAIRDLSLNYDIQAQHSAKRAGDDEEINTVKVVWTFWK